MIVSEKESEEDEDDEEEEDDATWWHHLPSLFTSASPVTAGVPTRSAAAHWNEPE